MSMEDLEKKLKIHGIYKHFKGDMYIVEDICYHSETKEPMVAYRQLYGEGQLWCRPLEMFLSEVDHEKYPEVKQNIALSFRILRVLQRNN